MILVALAQVPPAAAGMTWQDFSNIVSLLSSIASLTLSIAALWAGWMIYRIQTQSQEQVARQQTETLVRVETTLKAIEVRAESLQSLSDTHLSRAMGALIDRVPRQVAEESSNAIAELKAGLVDVSRTLSQEDSEPITAILEKMERQLADLPARIEQAARTSVADARDARGHAARRDDGWPHQSDRLPSAVPRAVMDWLSRAKPGQSIRLSELVDSLPWVEPVTVGDVLRERDLIDAIARTGAGWIVVTGGDVRLLRTAEPGPTETQAPS